MPADGIGQGEDAGPRILILPEAQKAGFQGVNVILTTRPPGAERGEGPVAAAPAVGGFIDAAAESQALARAVFNDAFLGVEDGPIISHLPLVEGQATRTSRWP